MSSAFIDASRLEILCCSSLLRKFDLSRLVVANSISLANSSSSSMSSSGFRPAILALN